MAILFVILFIPTFEAIFSKSYLVATLSQVINKPEARPVALNLLDFKSRSKTNFYILYHPGHNFLLNFRPSCICFYRVFFPTTKYQDSVSLLILHFQSLLFTKINNCSLINA